MACELGSDVDAARALSSLASVHMRTGAPTAAEAEALRALELLSRHADHLDESGNVRLVLGRALVEQGRFDEAGVAFRAAEDDFEGLGSVTLRAAVWVAKGDLDGRRGEPELAAVHYRRAAEALQEFRF
jgi:tetratricopeptide (TPR) repeat protein